MNKKLEEILKVHISNCGECQYAREREPDCDLTQECSGYEGITLAFAAGQESQIEPGDMSKCDCEPHFCVHEMESWKQKGKQEVFDALKTHYGNRRKRLLSEMQKGSAREHALHELEIFYSLSKSIVEAQQTRAVTLTSSTKDDKTVQRERSEPTEQKEKFGVK